MQRMTIIREDNLVGIDGVFYRVDCSSIPANVHAVQWYGDVSEGEIEWVQPRGQDKPSATRIESLDDYTGIIDMWDQEDANRIAVEVAEQAIAAARRETMATSGIDTNLSKV